MTPFFPTPHWGFFFAFLGISCLQKTDRVLRERKTIQAGMSL
jgi:hypothetical protein